MNMQKYILLFLTCLLSIKCNDNKDKLQLRVAELERKVDSLSYQKPPSATELFELRSKCAALGEKILRENVIGSALTQSEVSHYDPKTARCYVELTVQNADITNPTITSTYLYDGQTKELLAFAQIEKNVRSCAVWKKVIF